MCRIGMELQIHPQIAPSVKIGARYGLGDIAGTVIGVPYSQNELGSNLDIGHVTTSVATRTYLKVELVGNPVKVPDKRINLKQFTSPSKSSIVVKCTNAKCSELKATFVIVGGLGKWFVICVLKPLCVGEFTSIKR